MVEVSDSSERTDGNGAAKESKEPKAQAKCQACTSCRQKKVKCDGGKPTCTACQRSSTDCVYVPSRRRGRPARAHREYERPYANPQPILPRQPKVAVHNPSAHPPIAARILPTLPHVQPAQAGQGTLPPPPPSAPVRSAPAQVAPGGGRLPPIQAPGAVVSPRRNTNQHGQNQALAPLGSILAAALFPGSPHSAVSEDDAGISGHRSSGSESPLPRHVQPPAFLVPAGERGGHQTMAQATPLVIPRTTQQAPHAYMDPNVVEFFHYFNALFPVVHWPSFKEAYDDGTVPNYLVLAIRALSKRYSKQPAVVLSGQLYAAGQDLAAIATSLAEVATLEDPNTYLIQTWIILSMFEFGMGRTKQAADRREVAVRLAYKLELSHIEVRASQRRARSLIVAENCRRVWWSLFYADRYFSLVSGDPGICPVINESTYRVGFPRVMREATPPPNMPPVADIAFPRYMDHDVILWFQSAIPLSLVMGHLAHQCRAAEQLFRNGYAERPEHELWDDPDWVDALSEFVKNFLVIDAEITQWRQQLNAATTMPGEVLEDDRPHSTREVTLFHRELQFHGLVIIHQCLALYSYEKLRLRLTALSSACTPLLWLESTATQAWKKVVRSADIIRIRTNARATELANARASASGTMPNGAAPEPEWELCAPHMPFLLYLSAKVHVCQYHWQKIALARTRAESRRTLSRQPTSPEHVTPAFVQPFSQPPSVVATPAALQDGWGIPAAQHSTSTPGHVSSDDQAGTQTPVMTTMGAAALAAAQAAASKHSTPQQSRGGSTTHLYMLNGTHTTDGLHKCASNESHHSNPMRDEHSMNIDGEDDVEGKLAKRVESSKERLELLLKLLATCQEYWADHDYVSLLRNMLDWPDEWTTSMQMLERLLLELRID
ncbi:hypothetical protein FBU59_000758 [Linderina macrospora]|uniref:Uncharacterized protein n=2 Tax=Linderina macrospora TaxID=4868 RepID=A0ACC1JG11_9FUNG|nr:hypothetical protein FBU59_000758 [Linderina macrospora]